MKKERFDFAAMLISLFLLSAFVIEEQVRGTIAGTVSKTYKANKVRAGKAQETVKSNFINNSLLIDGGLSIKKKSVIDLRFQDAGTKNEGDIRLEQR